MHAFALWEEAGALWELGLSSMIPGTLLFILQVKVGWFASFSGAHADLIVGESV